MYKVLIANWKFTGAFFQIKRNKTNTDTHIFWSSDIIFAVDTDRVFSGKIGTCDEAWRCHFYITDCKETRKNILGCKFNIYLIFAVPAGSMYN